MSTKKTIFLIVLLVVVIIIGFVVQKVSGVGFGTDLDVGNVRIIKVATPTTSTDAANKSYVDTRIAGVDGATNYLIKWDASSPLALIRSIIYDNGTLVGIGTVSPGYRLEVVGGPIKATDGLIMEVRNTDPSPAAVGQIWLRSDL